MLLCRVSSVNTFNRGKTYQGKITKQGNKWLRYAMIEAAQRAPISDSWLRDFHLRISRKKNSKLARVKIAKKLLEYLLP